MEEEIWKEVTSLCSRNYRCEITHWYSFPKGKYYVSNLGRLKRNGTIVSTKADLVGTKTIYMEGHRFKLHEIVLQTFIPDGNISGYSPDHINRANRLDNSLNNLRWASRKTQYANRENKEYKYKKVKCIENGIIYPSCQDAEKNLGLVKNTVSRVARGERKSIHGYHFSYVGCEISKEYIEIAKQRIKNETMQMQLF